MEDRGCRLRGVRQYYHWDTLLQLIKEENSLKENCPLFLEKHLALIPVFYFNVHQMKVSLAKNDAWERFILVEVFSFILGNFNRSQRKYISDEDEFWGCGEEWPLFRTADSRALFTLFKIETMVSFRGTSWAEVAGVSGPRLLCGMGSMAAGKVGSIRSALSDIRGDIGSETGARKSRLGLAS